MAIVYVDGRVEHAGRVLKIESRDERIMSDVYAFAKYAVCVHEGTGALVSVRLGDCEFGQHATIASYAVDATEAAIAAHEHWLKVQAQLADKHAAEARKARAAAAAKRPAKGKRCVVARGRKVPKGTVGVCIWVGEGHYGERCGIKDAAGEVHWTASKNVDAIAS